MVCYGGSDTAEVTDVSGDSFVAYADSEMRRVLLRRRRGLSQRGDAIAYQ